MAWIPLLLASWIVVDVLIVAIMLAVARRRRQLAAKSPEPAARTSLSVAADARSPDSALPT